jgi:hypothetical protein
VVDVAVDPAAVADADTPAELAGRRAGPGGAADPA